MVMISCVKTGTKYSKDYVLKLRNGVMRYAPDDTRFVCFTDDPVEGVECHSILDPQLRDAGWWAKIYLYSLDVPLINFDLDIVITGDLRPLIDWEGFGIIDDWNVPGYNSSVMKLTGKEGIVWDTFRPNVMNMMRGDQDWLNVVLPNQKTFPREWFPSYKGNGCAKDVPAGSIACIMHGFPKPHQCGGWVKEMWV